MFVPVLPKEEACDDCRFKPYTSFKVEDTEGDLKSVKLCDICFQFRCAIDWRRA